MEYEFEYSAVQTYLARYTVKDISNVCLKMTGGLHKEWYICVSTELGESKIFTLGPIEYFNDKLLILPDFTFKYERVGYSERKIITKIDKILNNGLVTNVEEISKEDFLCLREDWKDAEYY